MRPSKLFDSLYVLSCEHNSEVEYSLCINIIQRQRVRSGYDPIINAQAPRYAEVNVRNTKYNITIELLSTPVLSLVCQCLGCKLIEMTYIDIHTSQIGSASRNHRVLTKQIQCAFYCILKNVKILSKNITR